MLVAARSLTRTSIDSASISFPIATLTNDCVFFSYIFLFSLDMDVFKMSKSSYRQLAILICCYRSAAHRHNSKIHTITMMGLMIQPYTMRAHETTPVYYQSQPIAIIASATNHQPTSTIITILIATVATSMLATHLVLVVILFIFIPNRQLWHHYQHGRPSRHHQHQHQHQQFRRPRRHRNPNALLTAIGKNPHHHRHRRRHRHRHRPFIHQ